LMRILIILSEMCALYTTDHCDAKSVKNIDFKIQYSMAKRQWNQTCVRADIEGNKRALIDRYYVVGT
jgi:hypothetical protein